MDLAAPQSTLRPSHRWILFAAVALLLALLGWRSARRENQGDLRVFYDTVGRVPRGLDLYQYKESATPEQPTGFIYPPLFALLFVPLTALPFPLVRGLWFFLMGLCALRSFLVAHGLARRERAPPPHAWLAAGIGVLVGLRFVWSDLGHGQANLLVIWLTLEGIALASRGKDGWGGALLAAAVLIKLTPAIIVTGYLVRGRWRVVMGACLGGLAGLLAPSLILGLGGNLDALWRFATVVTGWNDSYHTYVGNNASLTSCLQRLLVGAANPNAKPEVMLLALPAGPVRAFCALLSLTLLVGSLALTRSLRGDTERNAVLLAAIPLISPVAWKPHLVCLILPLLLASECVAREGPRRRWALALALALLGATGRFPLGRTLSNGFIAWGGTTLGIALLFGALLLAGRGALEARAPLDSSTPSASA